MSKNKIKSFSGIVFSTDPNFKPEAETIEEEITLSPALQKINVRLETKHRAGGSKQNTGQEKL